MARSPILLICPPGEGLHLVCARCPVSGHGRPAACPHHCRHDGELTGLQACPSCVNFGCRLLDALDVRDERRLGAIAIRGAELPGRSDETLVKRSPAPASPARAGWTPLWRLPPLLGHLTTTITGAKTVTDGRRASYPGGHRREPPGAQVPKEPPSIYPFGRFDEPPPLTADTATLEIVYKGAAAWNSWICNADRLPPWLARKKGAALEPKIDALKEARAFLRRADLVDRDLAGFDLRRVDLQVADLRRATLINASLIDSHVEGADFSRAQCRNADFSFTTFGETISRRLTAAGRNSHITV